MEVFFNEVSMKPASSDTEASELLVKLAELGQLLQKIVESLQEGSFKFRRKEDFAETLITPTQTIRDFLFEYFDYSDPVVIFLYGIFDSPYITEDDPVKTVYDYTSLIFEGQELGETGIAAAYLKESLAVSFDNEARWNLCDLDVVINRANFYTDEIVEKRIKVKHASKKQHVLDCHLPLLSDLFDWGAYKPKFNFNDRSHDLLPLIEVYTLHLEEDTWENFYENISQLNERERINKINFIANHIAQLQHWEEATGSLKTQNINRTVYTIPRSNFIIGLDTQHGEFEIHSNHKGNNHLGALSFDGKRFKKAEKDRSLKI